MINEDDITLYYRKEGIGVIPIRYTKNYDLPNVKFMENRIDIKDEYIVNEYTEDKLEENYPNVKHLDGDINIINDYTNENDNSLNEYTILYAYYRNNYTNQSKNSMQVMLSIKDNVMDIITKDSNRKIPIKLYNDILAVKNNVFDIINNDPKYQYMMDNITKSLIAYDFVTLIIAIGTLNPLGVVYGLYALGKNLKD